VEAIVSDSTTIITLTNISRVDILSNLFDRIYIPKKVYEEIVEKENVCLDDTFFIKKVIENKDLYHLLKKSLDDGESEAIVLAKEFGSDNSTSFINGVLDNIKNNLIKTGDERQEDA